MSGPGPRGAGAAASARERAVRNSMAMGMVNFVPRLAVALISGSATLYTDAMKSATETLANFCSWRAVRRIARGGQAEFEFGLGKLENLTSLLIAGATVATVAIMGIHSLHRLAHPVEVGRLGPGLVVSFLSGVVSWALWRQSRRAAREEPSPLMESHWRLMRNKFMGNVCVMGTLALSVAFRGHPGARYIDPAGSLLLCGFICFSLYGMLAGSLSALLDKTLEEHLQIAILRNLAAFESRYAQLHGIRSRRSGSAVFIDVFLEFDGTRSMDSVQADVDAITAALERDVPNGVVVVVPARRAPGARPERTE